MMSFEELEAEVMKLPDEERERLGEKLLASVDVSLDYEEAWAEEVTRRVREICDGDVELEDGDDVLEDVLDRLR